MHPRPPTSTHSITSKHSPRGRGQAPPSKQQRQYTRPGLIPFIDRIPDRQRRRSPGTSIGITLARPSRPTRQRTRDKLNQIRLYNLQRIHLLSNAARAIPALNVPLRATRSAVARSARTGAAGSSSLCGGRKACHDVIGCPRRDFGGCGHPAGEVGFEGELIWVAVVVGLAFDFPHDVGGVYGGASGVGGEEGGAGVEEALGAVVPDLGLGLLGWMLVVRLGGWVVGDVLCSTCRRRR